MIAQIQEQIPAAAARFKADRFKFSQEDDPSDGVPVRIFARTEEPIFHWYWGKIAHDMEGLTLHKESLPIDYCHDPDQVIGYLDEFEPQADSGLTCRGFLLAQLDARAAEIVAKWKQGVPYEASIDWTGPKVLEWVEEGAEADVNGYTFTGPGYIVRKWTLRGVAICPYGADMSTETSFDGDGPTVAVTIFSQSQKGPQMPQTKNKGQAQDAAGLENQTLTTPQDQAGGNPPADPPATSTQDQAAADPPADPPANPPATSTQDQAAADPPAGDRAELARFMADFGDTLGAQLWRDGDDYATAASKFAAVMREENQKLTDKVAELETQLKAARHALGDDPATFQSEPDGTSAATKQQAQRLGSEALAAYAASFSKPDAN